MNFLDAIKSGRPIRHPTRALRYDHHYLNLSCDSVPTQVMPNTWVKPDFGLSVGMFKLEDILATGWEVKPDRTYRLTLEDLEQAYNNYHKDERDFEGGGKAFASWIRRHYKAEERT